MFGSFGEGIRVTATRNAVQITFAASGANVAYNTALLLQSLAHGGQVPKPNLYCQQSFSTILSAIAVRVPTGWNVPAYRFVNSATRQEGPLIRLVAILVMAAIPYLLAAVTSCPVVRRDYAGVPGNCTE